MAQVAAGSQQACRPAFPAVLACARVHQGFSRAHALRPPPLFTFSPPPSACPMALVPLLTSTCAFEPVSCASLCSSMVYSVNQLSSHDCSRSLGACHAAAPLLSNSPCLSTRPTCHGSHRNRDRATERVIWWADLHPLPLQLSPNVRLRRRCCQLFPLAPRHPGTLAPFACLVPRVERRLRVDSTRRKML